MKKKISLIGLVLILVFGFTGCGKSDTAEYDQAMLEQYADFIVQNFSAMSETDFESFSDMSDLELDLTLLNTGVPVSGENFLTMIEAWKVGQDECGLFVSLGDYTMETTNDGATLSAEADFEEKDGTIEFAFDESMNMESITVSAHYTTGEILEKAALNTILGMGTVFVVLIFISFIISLFKLIPVLEKKFRKGPKAETVQESAPAAPASATDEIDDGELAAVIAAAVAAAEGTSTDGFIVRSIKRRKSNRWN
ncbi:MAG TPA: OadG family protein [Candidatus Mediterraneibacter pullicola]|uniref:OadG family protein n=1 Tax=Candidatus Mediterraneibacter pullicola TaxID=2838682 RepID=A0A9D2H9J0_9FIRM|nr:OadG family protein [Candidatus Mediterraneibacter pullicola]